MITLKYEKTILPLIISGTTPVCKQLNPNSSAMVAAILLSPMPRIDFCFFEDFGTLVSMNKRKSSWRTPKIYTGWNVGPNDQFWARQEATNNECSLGDTS